MSLSKKFRNHFSEVFLELHFETHGNYYYKEIQDAILVAGINFSSKTTKDKLFITITIALKNKKLLFYKGYKGEFNLMQTQISKTVENEDISKYWLIIEEGEIVENINYIKGKIQSYLMELQIFCYDPLKLLDYYIDVASTHPIFSNDIIESLLFLSAIYKPYQLNESLALALRKAKDKYDQQFINEMIKEITTLKAINM